MTDVDALLVNAQRAELPVDLYLGPPDLPHTRKRLEDEPPDEGMALPAWQERRAALDDLAIQIRKATLTTRVRALPHREWADHVIAHPPRDGVAEDRRRGVNTSTFWAVVVPLCLPDLTRGQYEKLDAVISEGDWAKVCSLVEAVNTGTVQIPKLPDGLPTSPNSGGTSKQPNASASA